MRPYFLSALALSALVIAAAPMAQAQSAAQDPAPAAQAQTAAQDPVLATEDRLEGYQYPPVISQESFRRRLIDGPPNDDPDLRERFVTMMTRAQLDAPETPRFSVFAKGGDSTRMIIIALDDEVFRTLYRARAVLAQLSVNLRTSPLFVERGLDTTATFFDMLQLLGFETLTVSDGADWSHRVTFE
jgi:hypothetical protein